MQREVSLLLSKDKEIYDRRVSFTSKVLFEEGKLNKAHDYIVSLLLRFPKVVLGNKVPSLVVNEVSIQESLFGGAQETRGSIDIMYLGIEYRHIDWGAFVEVKGSYEAEKEYNKFRRKGGSSELPIRNAFRQIARHMHYISLIEGFDFSNGDFTYFLVFPRCSPNELEGRVLPFLGENSRKPAILGEEEAILTELDALIRLVEITDVAVRFRESLISRTSNDMVLEENIMLKYSPKNLRPIEY